MKKGFKKQGFTLIELIVAVSIIAMMVGIFLANYSGSESQSQLINATSMLMRDIRTAQTKDAAHVNYGSESPTGWGINLVASSSAYQLFADLNGDYLYSSSTEGVAAKGARAISLPSGIVISSMDGDPMNIVFYHDQDVLKTYLTSGSVIFVKPITITLTELNSGAVKHVYVSPYGLIYSDL